MASVASAADWPQFLGPNGNGVSSETGLMREFPAAGPTVLWKFDLSAGYGGAAIRDGKVYLMDRAVGQKDILRCLDLADGKELWTFNYDAPGRIDHEGSRCTPLVTDKHVYIIGPFGQLHCIDLASHQVVWKKHILNDYGGRKPNWAVAQSVTPYKNTVIVAPQSNTVGMVAFEQDTGKEVWKSGPIGKMDYGSPMIITIDGVDQAVIVNSQGAAAVSAAHGNVLWQYSHRCQIPVPNVTDMGGGKLFVTGGYNAGSAIIQVSKSGDAWSAKELSKLDRIGGHCHPALFFKDHLYLLCNTNERNEGLVCIDGNCQVVWSTKRNPWFDKGGSILTGDGLMYVMDGNSGELYIVDPSADGFKPLSKAKLLQGREIWGPLALSNGKLVIRDQSQVKCVNIKP